MSCIFHLLITYWQRQCPQKLKPPIIEPYCKLKATAYNWLYYKKSAITQLNMLTTGSVGKLDFWNITQWTYWFSFPIEPTLSVIHFDQLYKLAVAKPYDAAETLASPRVGRRLVAGCVSVPCRTAWFLPITAADVHLLMASDNLRPMTKMKTLESTTLDKLREIIA